MDLLDRYLTSVGFLLPLNERGEILAELRDILMSKFEEKEEAQGRPLNDLEREAVIYDFGHPLVVAGRYRKDTQVIGPGMYPFWLLVMQIAGAATVVSAVVQGILRGLERGSLGAAISTTISHGVTQFVALTGVVTLVFLYMERSGKGQKMIDRWRPSQLPAIALKAKGPFERRFELVFEVAGGLVALLFWTGLAPMPVDYPTHQGQAVHLMATPLLSQVFWPVTVLIIARIATNLVELFQLGVRVHRLGFRLVVSLAGLGILAFALWASGLNGLDRATLAAGPFVHITGLPEPVLTQANYGTNLGIAIAIVVGIVGSLIEAGGAAIRMRQRP